MHHTVFPESKSLWENLKSTFPQHKFFIVTQQPSLFLLDAADFYSEKKYKDEIKISQAKNPQELAEDVLSFSPDLAIAASYWLTPYDWLSLEDSLAAEIIASKGIKVLSHPAETSLLCFNKWRTHLFLSEKGFTLPQALYVHHDLFWAERRNKEIKTNAYKDYIKTRLSSMEFPLVIKDTAGVSSYRMEVCRTFGEAWAFLSSGKNQSDKIVETYIQGLQCGVEIYGEKNNYTVMKPLMFSVNKYGITSPRQGVKLGPLQEEKFPLESLEKEMLLLADLLDFSGIAQVDLVFSKNKWYIIEINPRLSGMTSSYASSLGMSVLELLVRIALGEKINVQKMKSVCNMKIPLAEEKDLQKISLHPSVHSVRQIHNLEAKQERERGFGEIVFCGKDNKLSSLKEELNLIKEKFTNLLEADFVTLAETLLQDLDP